MRINPLLQVVVCGSSCVLWLAGCGRHGPPPMMNMPPPEVAVITVEEKPQVLTTELPGRTAAFLMAEIRPQVNGLIQKRLFVEGSHVTEGQALYQIDPAPFQAALENAQAALARSEANLPAVRARAKRVEELLAAKVLSQQDGDDASAALKAAEAEVQALAAAVEAARIQLGYTKILAPISGRIGKSSVTDGAIVTAYQPMPLATIQQFDPIYVDVPQSTADLLRLQKRLAEGRLTRDGDNQNAVQLILEDSVLYPHEGALKFRDVSVDPTTGTVTLRMVFPNPDGVLLPGMFVRALVKEGVKSNAILIPQQAVMRGPKGNALVMLVNGDGKVEPRPVELDRALGHQWLLAGGLAPGDQVIVEGLLKARPGAPVKPVPFAPVKETAHETQTRH